MRFSFERFKLRKRGGLHPYLIEMLEGTGTITLHSKWMAMFKMKTAIMKNILGRRAIETQETALLRLRPFLTTLK